MDLDLRAGLIGPAGDGGSRDTPCLVAGAGPAGLAAALYLARFGVGHVVLEGWQPGGQAALTDRIENYPGLTSSRGPELTAAMRGQAVAAGSEILPGLVRKASRGADGRLAIDTEAGAFAASALIIATGAAPSRLGVPGEDRFYGRGVSYCATCDAPFFRGRRVMVVGGGDSAVKEALHLANFASSVTIVHRRDRFRAEPALAERIMRNPVCTVLWNTRVREILGGEGVTGVLLETPAGDRTLEIDGVFVYVGRRPATEPFAGLVDLDPEGTVATSRIVRTSARDVFAAGDVTSNPLRQVVTAAADGARAAAEVWHMLEGA